MVCAIIIISSDSSATDCDKWLKDNRGQLDAIVQVKVRRHRSTALSFTLQLLTDACVNGKAFYDASDNAERCRIDDEATLQRHRKNRTLAFLHALHSHTSLRHGVD